MDAVRFLHKHRDRLFPLSLLVVSLVVIYGIYLSHLVGVNASHDPEPTMLRAFLGRVLLVSAIAGTPFAAMAYMDPRWRSRHAAEIAMGTWALVFGFFVARHGGGCPLIAIFLFIPLTFGALAGHAIGTMRHPPQVDEDDDESATLIE